MVEALKKISSYNKRTAPVVLVVMDGVGFGKYEQGDVVKSANTPNLDWLMANCDFGKLKAHGLAVGLPSDADMGNSEVGHNAIGCGRVFAQGAKLVADAISSKKMFSDRAWTEVIANVLEKESTLHFFGLLSDGNVHSHISHIEAMLKQAKEEGVKKVRVHTLFDGRDVGSTSGLDYIKPFEELLASLSTDGFDYRVASGGGRQNITMDRYDADWSMIQRGWDAHVKGIGQEFTSGTEAYTTMRETTGDLDQDLPAFVVVDEAGKPVGPITDGDSVVNFNFRGDRAIEISLAFTAPEMTKFDRGPLLDVVYAGMMQYDGDAHVPPRFLVEPPAIDRTLMEYLSATGLKTLSISETQKFGHMTYFFNGNNSAKFNDGLETWVEVPSDVVPFEERPWMKCAEVTDHIIDALENEDYNFIGVNYPNGDMVGHTGICEAVQVSMEALDLQIGRLIKVAEKTGATLIFTADHGNADDMFEHNKKSGEVVMEDGKPKTKTSHSLNPVPCIIFDTQKQIDYKFNLQEGQGISSLTATCMNLLGYVAPSDYDTSVVIVD